MPPSTHWVASEASASRQGFSEPFFFFFNQRMFPFLVYNGDYKQSASPLIIVSGSDV